MSNAVFPTLPGLTFGVTRSPVWSTTKRTAVSQRSYRTANVTYPLYRYKLTYEFLRQSGAYTEFSQLAGFFNARGGDFDSFLFTDPDDNAVTAQAVGVGDGVNKYFQLVRTFGGYVEPVFDVNGVPTILWNGGSANLIQNSEPTAFSGGLPYGMLAYCAATYTLTGSAGYYGVKATSAAGVGGLGLMGGGGAVGGGYIGGVRAGGWQKGVTYTLSFMARKAAGGASWTAMGLGWNNAPDTQVVVANPTLTSGWQQYTFQLRWDAATPEAGGNWFLYAQGATAINDELHIRYLQVVVGTALPAWTNSAQSYTISAGGLVTFDFVPPVSTLVGWTGTFYRRVVFTQPMAEFAKFMANLWELKTVEFESAKP